jgi:GNAT superfamily N-acetyltransferase
MSVAPVIRPGEAQDLGWVPGLLADALAGYPWTRWIVSPDEHELRLRALHRLYITEIALPFGELWVDDGRAGAAAWTRSGDARTAEAQQRIGPEVADLAGDRVHQAIAAEDALSTARPRDPHWFLIAVGVDAGRRGRGLGTALLEPRLRACDAEGEPAALETAAAETLPQFERLGFEVTAEVQLPDGGPPVWLMWRAPARRA